MKRKTIIITSGIVVLLASIVVWKSCNSNHLEEKGFAISKPSVSDQSDTTEEEGINKDSVKLDTRPSAVLLTGLPAIRLTTLYKVNINPRSKHSFIGSNNFLQAETEHLPGNNWNGHLIPGFSAAYGYNLVDISHYNIQTNVRKDFFGQPVLIKTLYFPSFTTDTLNGKIVKRNYFLVSVYNADTNKDGYINLKDLRRFYWFDTNGCIQKPIVPTNYSVYKSEYDPANDYLYIFARYDQNKNGQIDDNEPANVFWLNLQDPSKTGKQY